MGKISTYDNASPVSLDDKIIGTSVDGSPVNVTKNFLVSDLVSLVNASAVAGAANGLSTVPDPSGLLVVLGGALYSGLTTIEGGTTSDLQIGSAVAPLGFLSTTTDNAQGAGTTTFNATNDIKLNNTTANTSISVTDTNSGSESGVEIKTLKIVGATASVTDVLTLVNATTGEAEFNPVVAVAGKYVANFLVGDFTGSSLVYTLTAATHGKGTSPIVQIYDATDRLIRQPGPFVAYARSVRGAPFTIGYSFEIVADNPGVDGNGIAIVLNGIDTVDYWVNQWNLANPNNTATITYSVGAGYIGTNLETYRLSGGASFINSIKIEANGDIKVEAGVAGAFDGTIIVM